jgi:hypothetical protein
MTETKPTLPSLQTKAEQLEAAVQRNQVKAIPGLVDELARHETAMEALAQAPLIESEKLRQRREAESALQGKVAELREAARVEALRSFNEAEGRLRAAARADGTQASDVEVRAQVFRHQRAQQLATRADRAGTVQAAREVYAEAQLTQDETTIRTVGAAVLEKLDRLSQTEAGKAVRPLSNAAQVFRQEFSGWQREHPSITQQLDRIQRARSSAELLFEESANFALRLFGVGRSAQAPKLRPVPEGDEPRRGLVYGSHWDRIAGRK